MSEPFVLGVNYWPRRKAMYWWSNFDREEVREEFAIIRELGLKMVRIFLLWEDFQPAPDVVSTESLRNLETVCDIAAENGLGLNVTFFTGHMSGPNWAPGWLLQGAPLPKARQLVSGGQVVNSGYRNPYTDPLALSAERLQLSTVVSALKDHPGIAVWNLGNEPDIFAVPPSDADGQNWVRDMTRLIKEIDPKHPVTCGLHVASLRDNVGLRVDQVFAETDFGVMHAYPMYASYARGPLDPDFVPFTCALTRYLSGKPVLMEEFGGCTVAPGEPSTTWNWLAYGQPREQFMASEEDFAAYIQAVLPRLVEVGATGALLWCFADYIPELWNRPPCEESRHERFFGLVRPDGSLKPHAEVLRSFAATQPVMLPTPLKNPAFNINPDEYYQHPFENMVKLYKQYLS